MSGEPFYSPDLKPAPPRQPKPGELLFEFYVERTKKVWRVELRDHGVVSPPHGSSITVSHFIRVTGAVPDWVRRCARPYEGKIPADRPVFPVDTLAERREQEEIAAAVRKQQEAEAECLTNEELQEDYDWSERDLSTLKTYGLPAPVNHRVILPNGNLLGGTSLEQRKRIAVDAWGLKKLDEIAELLPLLSKARIPAWDQKIETIQRLLGEK